MVNNFFNSLTVIIFCVVYYFPSFEKVAADLKGNGNVSIISSIELQGITEELFDNSSYELYKYVSINYQGQTTLKNFTDNAPDRLLTVPSEIFSSDTTKSLIKLFDNYEVDTRRPEIITEEKDAEQDEFINYLMATNTMIHTMNFLSKKGFFANDSGIYKEVLKTIWFCPYSRDKGINSSSGFEHVFLAEKKPRKGIVGLHNWIFFSIKELSNKINYFGFYRNTEFLGKAALAEVFFTYEGKRKMSTIFIGSTPEFEVALYTLCFFARPNKRCHLTIGGINFGIQTYVLKNGNKKVVAAAFPIVYKKTNIKD